MSLQVRDGKFDVAIVAGPRLAAWPSAGARVIAQICAEMGLTVGVFGGDSIAVRGVITLPGPGGIVLAQDIQNRIHRLHSRAVVKITQASEVPDPFEGWRSQGLIPLSSARRLRKESKLVWDPCTVILGTGNPALRFGSELLESGAPEVYCIETFAQWGAKRFSGWEVERRRFETLGGKVLEAKPLKLTARGPLHWELRVQDAQGVRVLEVGRVVSAGPFRDLPGVREHPPGSFLFELEQSAGAERSENVEGWVLEEERGRYLAGKIVKALVNDLGDRREELDQVFRRARGRLKRYLKHREEPFTPSYQGKWMSAADTKKLREFSGTPRQAHFKRKLASIECVEEIPCNVCQVACPEQAIQIGRIPRLPEAVLSESKCTGCGICLEACPSGAISLLQEREERSTSLLTFPWRGAYSWKVGEFAMILNRRGESLGSARVVALPEIPGAAQEGAESKERSRGVRLVEVEVPSHLVWEARGLKRPKPAAAEDDAYLQSVSRMEAADDRIEITVNGEKRLVRDQIPVTVALFEMGQGRPEDVLFCKDGSCGLCQISIDGVKRLACQCATHRGMTLKDIESPAPAQGENALCSCLGVTTAQIQERLAQGRLKSLEAVLSVTHVGEGKCHGQLCMDAFRRVLLDQGLEAEEWVDWRFPWSEWVWVRS